MHSSVRDAIRVMHIACTTQTHTDRRRNIPASAKWMPINENEEVVVVAKRKGRSASVHRMHAGAAHAAMPQAASLQGEPCNRKLRQKATIEFATCWPPPRLPTAKFICTATACHARAAEA